jgi:predicted phosphoribosyltransferase
MLELRRLAIVVDDGIATGATTRAALRATRLRKPRELVLAIPVAPTEALAAMREARPSRSLAQDRMASLENPSEGKGLGHAL